MTTHDDEAIGRRIAKHLHNRLIAHRPSLASARLRLAARTIGHL
jgi:hypothetical protein